MYHIGKQRPWETQAEVRKKCVGLHGYWKEVGWERRGLRDHACYTKAECFGWHVLEDLWDRDSDSGTMGQQCKMSTVTLGWMGKMLENQADPGMFPDPDMFSVQG